MFEVRFTDDQIPQSYYLCLKCGKMLKTALDCVSHWREEHRGEKVSMLFCDDSTSTYEIKYFKEKRFKQSSLEEFMLKEAKK